MSLFSRGTLRSIAVATIACFNLLTTGCFNYVHIKPEEAEKLDAAVSTQEVRGEDDVYAVSLITVQQENGKLYEVHGEADLIVRTISGQELKFEHPLSVEMSADSLNVSSRNRAPTKFQVPKVEDVIVKDKAPVKTGLLAGGIVGGVLFGAAIASFVVIGNADSSL
jgi:hypothetical protein